MCARTWIGSCARSVQSGELYAPNEEGPTVEEIQGLLHRLKQQRAERNENDFVWLPCLPLRKLKQK